MNSVYILARAPGGQMRGAAPLRAVARRLAGCVARSSHTTRYARRLRLASEPGGHSKMQTLFIDRPLG